MCLPDSHLSLLPILGLSPNAPRHLWNHVYQPVLPLSQVSPHLRWELLTQWLQLQLWCGLQPFWIMPWDQWMPGAGHGDFRNLLPLAWWRNHAPAVLLATVGNATRRQRFPCARMQGCTHFLDAPGHFILHLSGKVSIVNSMISIQISQQHGSVKNKILYHTWWINLKYLLNAIGTRCFLIIKQHAKPFRILEFISLRHGFNLIHKFRSN